MHTILIIKTIGKQFSLAKYVCILVSLGPFTNSEMADWFSHGYFTMGLLVKRTTDDAFQPLGEVIKQWGRVPFIPGPQPPPFKVKSR